MRVRLLLFLLFFASLSVMGQGTVTRNSTRKTTSQKPRTPQSTPPTASKTKQKSTVKPLSQPTGYENGRGYVDLGLSVKWATCNVGANSPSDYGGYYAWGETNTKLRYMYDCFDYNYGGRWDIYNLKGGKNIIIPSTGHDTARENWGGTWRMPTDAENEELYNKCNWAWTSKDGHNGYVVTGPNGNSIFLPAAGWREDTDTYYDGEYGYYWSSTLSLSSSAHARTLYFFSSVHGTIDNYRRNGLCIRPVTE